MSSCFYGLLFCSWSIVLTIEPLCGFIEMSLLQKRQFLQKYLFSFSLFLLTQCPWILLIFHSCCSVSSSNFFRHMWCPFAQLLVKMLNYIEQKFSPWHFLESTVNQTRHRCTHIYNCVWRLIVLHQCNVCCIELFFLGLLVKISHSTKSNLYQKFLSPPTKLGSSVKIFSNFAKIHFSQNYWLKLIILPYLNIFNLCILLHYLS